MSVYATIVCVMLKLDEEFDMCTLPPVAPGYDLPLYAKHRETRNKTCALTAELLLLLLLLLLLRGTDILLLLLHIVSLSYCALVCVKVHTHHHLSYCSYYVQDKVM
jgi:hypothetical protein